MKAITIRQPWASLIAAGVKTIETRPRRTSYRGRIAIHAGLRPYSADEVPRSDAEREIEQRFGWPLPLGAVVASAVLTDCVPIVAVLPAADRAPRTRAYPSGDHIAVFPVHATSEAYAIKGNNGRDVADQLPFGDFTPGRWALLLDDIAPTTERCPACWGTAWSALCGRTDDGSDGPCVMRERHSGPCYGENDVASDWSPVLPCRTCCFCPCGSTSDGTECRYCGVTRTPGRCDPIPARGQQAVPWEWDPTEGDDRGQ